MKEYIKENNQIIGAYDYNSDNDKVVWDKYNRIAAIYRTKKDITTDSLNCEIGKGDTTMKALHEANEKY